MSKRIAIAALLTACLWGCSSVGVPVTVSHPAQYNLGQHKVIALDNISGRAGLAYTSALRARLYDSGRFKIVNYAGRKKALDELRLASSDLSAAGSNPGLGHLEVATVIITGAVDSDYQEWMDSKTNQYYDKAGNCRTSTTYTRHLRGSMYGNIELTEVLSGKVLHSSTIKRTCERATAAVDSQPAPPDRSSLLQDCADADMTELMHKLLPWQETIEISYLKDSKIKDLEQGINLVRSGQTEEAIALFAAAAAAAESNPKIKAASIAKAYWDIGLAYEYSWRFDQAVEAFRNAYKIDARQMYLDEISHARQLEKDQAKLKEQL